MPKVKDMQSGEIKSNKKSNSLLVQSIDEIFNLIDQIRSGQQDLNDTTAKEIESLIENYSQSPQDLDGPTSEPISLVNKSGQVFLKINLTRVHLPSQFKIIQDKLESLEKSGRVVLDLSDVRTIGSTGWGAIWAAGGKMDLSIIGMNKACETVFLRWNFDAHVKYFSSEQQLMQNLE